MPAKKGGGPRKGQVGKKAQIEKLVEAAKKSPPPILTNVQHYPAKQDNVTKKVAFDSKVAVRVVPRWQQRHDERTNPELKKHKKTHDNGSSLSVETCAQPPGLPRNKSPKLAIIRLPGQDPTIAVKTKHIVHSQVTLKTAATPKPVGEVAVVRLPPQKERVTFMHLPAEIRNVIYGLAMPRQKYHIQWIPRTDRRPTELTFTRQIGANFIGPCLTAKQGLRRREFDLRNPWQKKKMSLRFRHPPGPAALLLVNKKINQEASGYFYGRNVFSFRAMRPLKKFLDTMRPEIRSVIRSIELIHHTAGDPELTVNKIFKYRYDQCWDNLCSHVADQCTQLHSLTIDLTIKDIPFMMGARATWMGPLYYFYGLDNLKHLKIRLHQMETEEAVLEVEAYKIRQNLMTRENYYEPVSATLAKQSPGKKASPVRTLRLVGNVQTPFRPKKQPRVQEKVREEPDPLHMPQHPFDPTGRHKINGTGPYRPF
ncbi:MAG: hypothetical protein Q9218_001158 [Villophora microphyllina]